MKEAHDSTEGRLSIRAVNGPEQPEETFWSIRSASHEDVPAVLSLIRELAEYEHLAHTLQASQSALRELLFGNRRVADALLAVVGTSPVGFALFYENVSTFLGCRGLFLEDLYVRPAWRKRGIGASLLGAFARTAMKRGCGYVEWRTLDWNTSAIKFYEAHGAQPLRDWTVFRAGPDALTRLAEDPFMRPDRGRK